MILKLTEMLVKAPKDTQQAAKYILDGVEKIGMLPPKAEFEEYETPGYDSKGGYCTVIKREWETEGRKYE